MDHVLSVNVPDLNSRMCFREKKNAIEGNMWYMCDKILIFVPINLQVRANFLIRLELYVGGHLSISPFSTVRLHLLQLLHYVNTSMIFEGKLRFTITTTRRAKK